MNITLYGVYEVLKDIFAVLGVIWVALTLFFWASDAAKARSID